MQYSRISGTALDVNNTIKFFFILFLFKMKIWKLIMDNNWAIAKLLWAKHVLLQLILPCVYYYSIYFTTIVKFCNLVEDKI